MSELLKVTIRDERRVTGNRRDFTLAELGAFSLNLYQKLLRIPSRKIGLDRVAFTHGTETDISSHTELNCGSSFCVLGWALTDPKLSHDLAVTPVVVDEREEEYFDEEHYRSSEDGQLKNVITLWGAHEDGTDLDLDEAFLVEGENTSLSSFMFSGTVIFLDDEDESSQDTQKIEALLRCYTVHLACTEPDGVKRKSNQAYFRENRYVPYLMHLRGYVSQALDAIVKDTNMDIEPIAKWFQSRCDRWEDIFGKNLRSIEQDMADDAV